MTRNPAAVWVQITPNQALSASSHYQNQETRPATISWKSCGDISFESFALHRKSLEQDHPFTWSGIDFNIVALENPPCLICEICTRDADRAKMEMNRASAACAAVAGKFLEIRGTGSEMHNCSWFGANDGGALLFGEYDESQRCRFIPKRWIRGKSRKVMEQTSNSCSCPAKVLGL